MSAKEVSRRERVRRARRVGLTFGRIYLGIKTNQMIARRINPPDMTRRWSSFNRRSARSIYATAVELRGLILKGCQYLGARPDVVPREYVEILSKLQDRVPPKSIAVVRSVVEAELGKPVSEVFRRFSPRPIASASLAQVHRAELLDGRVVAVKVQYPEIETLVRGDLANLRMLFRAVGFLERDFDLLPLIDEFATYIPRELDFVNEGRNAETMAKSFAERDDVVVPDILWDYTTRRVLVMEYMEGIKISDVKGLHGAGVDCQSVVRILVEAYCQQVFRDGFFHADPHPGNLLVQPEGPRLVFLDFGLAKDLPPRFREGVVELALAMVREQPETMVQAFLDLGFHTWDDTSESLVEVARLLLEFTRRVRARSHIDPRVFEEGAQELMELVRANPLVEIPTHVVFLARVLGLLSGVSRSLESRIDLVRALLPYALAAEPASP